MLNRLPLLCLPFLLTTIAGCGGGGTKSETSPEISLQLLDFHALQQLIAGHRGQVVVVDCWSTACEPCKREFPKLVALHKKYGQQIACISLSFDYEGLGKPEDVQSRVLDFLRSQSATFDNVVSRLEADELYKQLAVHSVPTVLVYDRQGQFVKRFDREPIYEQVEPLVEKLVAAPAK